MKKGLVVVLLLFVLGVVSFTSAFSIFIKPTITGKVVSGLSSSIDSSVVGYWNFDYDFYDSSPRRNIVGILGTPTRELGGWNSSLRANNGYLSVNFRENLSNVLSVSLWVKPDSAVNKGAFSFGNMANDQGEYTLLFYNNAIFRMDKSGNEGAGQITSSENFNYYLNNWTHIVTTYDGANQKIYVNGKLSTSKAYNSTKSYLIYPLAIGAYYSSAYKFNGLIDEFIVFNKSLSASEVSGIYDAQKNYVRGASSCVNECSSAVCSSSTSVRSCGNYDSDPCLDLGTASHCSAGQSCSNGACVNVQTISCVSGQKVGDLNNDGVFNIMDYQIANSTMRDMILGILPWPANLCCMDASGEGNVTTLDITLINRYSLGLANSTRVCGGSSTCTDSDGGLNYNIFGVIVQCFNEDCGRVSDFCDNSTLLTEYYCSGNQILNIEKECENGCSNGACILSKNISNNLTCTDSDGGLNYNVKGTVSSCLFEGAGGCGSIDDTCPSPTYLTEYYCSGNQTLTIEKECPNGCLNGACRTNNYPSNEDFFKIERSNNKLNIDESIQLIYMGLDQTHMPHYLENVRIGELNYTQEITLGNLILRNFSDDDYNYGQYTYGFSISPGINILNYTLEFDIPSVIRLGQKIQMFGEDYRVSYVNLSRGRINLTSSRGDTLSIFDEEELIVNGNPISSWDAWSDGIIYVNLDIIEGRLSKIKFSFYSEDQIFLTTSSNLSVPYFTSFWFSFDGISYSNNELIGNLYVHGRYSSLSCRDFGYMFGRVGEMCLSSDRYDLSGCYNETSTCNDPDFGSDSIYHNTSLTGSTSAVFGSSCLGGGQGASESWHLSDECFNATLLGEGECDEENYGNLIETPCMNGCSNGACVPSNLCESGCSYNDKCVPLGYRASGKYCSFGGVMVNQSVEEMSCENNFECSTNQCIDGECISSTLWQRIIGWFRSIFGN